MEQQQKALAELQVALEQGEREKNYQQRITDQQTNQITGLKADVDKAVARADEYQNKLDTALDQHRGVKHQAESAEAQNEALKVSHVSIHRIVEL